MSYHELLATSKKDKISRDFCNLVDYVVMLHEEEEKQCKEKSKCYMKTKKKTLSEKEESDKRTFNFIKRKRRTLVTRRNPQRNLIKASNSSLFLLDPNTIAIDLETKNPRNPFSHSSSAPSLLDLNTIASETEMKNPQNPCSSSSLFLEDYKNAAEPENMEMVRNPQNPCPSSSLFLGSYKNAAESEKMEMVRNAQNPCTSSSLFLGGYKNAAESEKMEMVRNPQNPCPSSLLFLGSYKNAAESEKMEMVRNPQNPCTSSLFLGGYKNVAESEKMVMVKNPQNPHSSSSLFLGGYKNADESEKMVMVRNPQNPRSSSSLFLGGFKIAAESEKNEMMTNQQNPNLKSSSSSSCLTENTSSQKRRAVQERNPNPVGKSKKPKVVPFSWKGRETPEWLNQLMQDMNGTELKLIFERTLFTTDVNPGQSRLSMPSSELICKDFLTPAETRIIEEDIDNDKKIGVGSILVDHRNVKWGVILKRWEMKSGSWNYTLTCGWNEIVKANGLKQGDSISVWSFRSREVLCFALLLPPPSSITQSSSVSE